MSNYQDFRPLFDSVKPNEWLLLYSGRGVGKTFSMHKWLSGKVGKSFVVIIKSYQYEVEQFQYKHWFGVDAVFDSETSFVKIGDRIVGIVSAINTAYRKKSFIDYAYEIKDSGYEDAIYFFDEFTTQEQKLGNRKQKLGNLIESLTRTIPYRFFGFSNLVEDSGIIDANVLSMLSLEDLQEVVKFKSQDNCDLRFLNGRLRYKVINKTVADEGQIHQVLLQDLSVSPSAKRSLIGKAKGQLSVSVVINNFQINVFKFKSSWSLDVVTSSKNSNPTVEILKVRDRLLQLDLYGILTYKTPFDRYFLHHLLPELLK